MSFLLDTNVVSELRKRPGVVDPHVVDWAQRHPARDLYISVVTVLEIELGVADSNAATTNRALRYESGWNQECLPGSPVAFCR